MRGRWTIPVWMALLAVGPAATATVQDDLDALLGDAQSTSAADEPAAGEDPTPASGADSEADAQTTDVIPLPREPAPTDDVPARASRSRLVEEIVVTAQKREENLQDVPISVQAFSGEKLDAMGITDQTDLQRVTPGLNITSQVSYVVTFLRGVGTDAVTAADPSVATYIDGIYFPFASNLAQNFGAVERIEVLKGPQGTLFGRNATGGAISIHAKKPDFDDAFGELLLSADTHTRMARLYGNVPLSDSFAINASAVTSTFDNFYTGTRGNPPTGIPEDDTEGFRIKARWQPRNDLELQLAMFRLELHGAAANIAYNARPSTLGMLQGIQPQPGTHGAIDAPAYTQTDANTVYYGNLEYNAPWFDFKIIASDQRMDTAGIRDFDGSPQAISTFDTPSQYIDARSLEVQFLSNDEFGPDWFRWILGGYYFEGVNGFEILNFIVNGISLEQGTLGPLALPEALRGLIGLAQAAPSGALSLTGLIGTDSRAVFAQTTTSVTDWLDVTLGGRYQVEERYIYDSSVGLDNGDGTRTELIDNTDRATDSNGDPYPAKDTRSTFSPKVSLDLRPFNDDTLIYLSWQKALKAATYNTVAIYDQPDYVKPEEIVAWELGAKFSAFDGLLRLNGAVFDYDVANLQQAFISLFAGGVISFQNAGRARIRGADFDGVLVLLPSLVDDLVLAAGAAWLDAEYQDFTGAAGFDEAGFFSQDNDYSGNQVIRSPSFTGTLSLSKTWGVPGGPFETAFDAYYTDDFFYEPSNRQATLQESYWLLGARLSYLYEPLDLRLTAGVRNLTDEFYTNGIFVTDYGVQPSIAMPRTYSLQLVWNF
jgi:iron complex outermembrane recepter protein